MATTERAANDFYPTPAPLTQMICQRLALEIPAPRFVIEPSAGAGPFVYYSRWYWPTAHITAIDNTEEARQPCMAAGANEFVLGDWPSYISEYELESDTLIIGNPPFSVAQRHIEAGLAAMPNGGRLAFLLRVGFWGSFDRLEFWKNTPLRHFIPIVPRPSFRKVVRADGKKSSNDNSEYGIYLWEVGYQGRPEILPHIVWKESTK